MRRTGLIILFAFAIMAGGAIAQNLPFHADPTAREIVADDIRVPAIRFLTTGDFPPFEFRDPSGALVGFNIDLAREICGVLGVACTVQSWPWEQAANALADHQGDALIAGLALSDENGERFDFSSIYLMLPARFVIRDQAALAFSVQSLAGRNIAVRQGSSHAGFVERYIPDAKPLPFETEIEALEAVRYGEADAYFGDAMRASFWLNDNPDCCTFTGEAYFRPDLFGAGLAIAVPAGSDAVRQALNSALVRLKRNGRLDELYLRWFPVSFY